MASRVSNVPVTVNRPSQPSLRVSRHLDSCAAFRSQIRSQRAVVAPWLAAGPADTFCYQGASTSRCGLSSNSSSKQPYGTPPGVYPATKYRRSAITTQSPGSSRLASTFPERCLRRRERFPIPLSLVSLRSDGPRKDPPFDPTISGGPRPRERPERTKPARRSRVRIDPSRQRGVQHPRSLQHGGDVRPTPWHLGAVAELGTEPFCL